MPKLELNNNFVNKLNSIMKKKLTHKLPKVSQSTSALRKPRPFPSPISSSPSPISSSPPIQESPIPQSSKSSRNNSEIIFKKVLLNDMSDIGLMWESFDDSIKKIVINEIVEKYYFYKHWKLNTNSFVLGILFTFLVIFFSRFLKT